MSLLRDLELARELVKEVASGLREVDERLSLPSGFTITAPPGPGGAPFDPPMLFGPDNRPFRPGTPGLSHDPLRRSAGLGASFLPPTKSDEAKEVGAAIGEEVAKSLLDILGDTRTLSTTDGGSGGRGTLLAHEQLADELEQRDTRWRARSTTGGSGDGGGSRVGAITPEMLAALGIIPPGGPGTREPMLAAVPKEPRTPPPPTQGEAQIRDGIKDLLGEIKALRRDQQAGFTALRAKGLA